MVKKVHIRHLGLTAPRILQLLLAAGALCAAALVAASFGMIPGFTLGKADGVTGSPITMQTGYARCAYTGQPPTPTPHMYWVHLASTAPADVLAAMKSAEDYMTPLQAVGAAGTNTYSFDAPVLVKPAFYRSVNPDLPRFMVRAYINGVRSVTYEVVYDPAFCRIRMSSVGGQSPRDPAYGKAFPFAGISSQAAILKVQSARGVAIAAGYTPDLVYFSPHPNYMPPHATIQWWGGGTDPADPMWRLKGTDGKLYFVGIDGVVYDPAQLPVEPGMTLIQP